MASRRSRRLRHLGLYRVGHNARYRTRDHIVPKSRGADDGSNIAIVCNVCNRDKADMLLGEWLGWLQHMQDWRAPRIEALLGVAIAGDGELAVEVGIDIEVGWERAERRRARMRYDARMSIGFESVI